MNALDFLEQLKDVDNVIKSLEEEYEKLMTKATNINVKYRDVVAHSGSCSSPQEQQGPEMAEYSKQIQEMQKELNTAKTKAMKNIKKMDSFKHKSVLIKYYVQNKTLAKAAEEMNISDRWASELKKQAVKMFEKNFK